MPSPSVSSRTPPSTGTGARLGRLRATKATASARASRSTRNFIAGPPPVGRSAPGGAGVLDCRLGRTPARVHHGRACRRGPTLRARSRSEPIGYSDPDRSASRPTRPHHLFFCSSPKKGRTVEVLGPVHGVDDGRRRRWGGAAAWGSLGAADDRIRGRIGVSGGQTPGGALLSRLPPPPPERCPQTCPQLWVDRESNDRNVLPTSVIVDDRRRLGARTRCFLWSHSVARRAAAPRRSVTNRPRAGAATQERAGTSRA